MIYKDIVSLTGHNQQGELPFFYPYVFPTGNLNSRYFFVSFFVTRFSSKASEANSRKLQDPVLLRFETTATEF